MNASEQRKFEKMLGSGMLRETTPHVGGAGCGEECEIHEVDNVAQLMRELNE